MTKEDILNKHDTSHKYIEQTCRPELFAAMDEWARTQGLEFVIFRDNFKKEESRSVKREQERLRGIITWVPASDEELYELFLKSK